MELKQTCKHCGGNGFTNIQIKVGDIIQPQDGSSMSPVLHRLLWNGLGHSAEGAFKPVRVLSIEGDMIAVVPLYWDNPDICHKERFDDKVYPTLCHVWKGTYTNANSICDYAFWINAPISNPIMAKRGNSNG